MHALLFLWPSASKHASPSAHQVSPMSSGVSDQFPCGMLDKPAIGHIQMACTGVIRASFSHAALAPTASATTPLNVQQKDLLPEDTRLSILCWTPSAIEQHLAGPWHSVALQESREFMDIEFIKNEFHIAHFRGCSTLFSKSTFEPDQVAFAVDRTVLQRSHQGRESVAAMPPWLRKPSTMLPGTSMAQVGEEMKSIMGNSFSNVMLSLPPGPHPCGVREESWTMDRCVCFGYLPDHTRSG